jgi:hypothetical protein
MFWGAAHLLQNGMIPSGEIADRMLAKLDHIESLDADGITEGIAQFTKHFPGKVFLLVWRRHQFKDAGESRLETFPDNIDMIGFADVMADPEAKRVVLELEQRLIDDDDMDYEEQQILCIVVMQSARLSEQHLLRMLDMVSTSAQLGRLVAFVEHHSPPIVLECAEFTRRLLAKARAIGDEYYNETFRTLVSLPGPRGFDSIEPDEKWKRLVEALEKISERYAGDPELGPFYAAVLKHERDWIADMRKSGMERERALEEELD